jgi:hypothetical protein
MKEHPIHYGKVAAGLFILACVTHGFHQLLMSVTQTENKTSSVNTTHNANAMLSNILFSIARFFAMPALLVTPPLILMSIAHCLTSRNNNGFRQERISAHQNTVPGNT